MRTHGIRKLPGNSLLIPIAMQTHRHIEANILGYRLDRVEADLPETTRYEVSSPENGLVLGHFPDRPSAERFIVMRELRQISTRPPNPAF